jgi:hypothetical protein
MSTSNEGRPRRAPARPEPVPGSLRGIADVELAITMRAESDAVARRMACEMCHEGITKQERIAIYDFLHKVAEAVRWPGFHG